MAKRPSRLRPGSPVPRGRRRRVLAFVAVCVLSAAGTLGLRSSLAFFTDTETAAASLRSQSIFSGQRSTPAFEVADRSSGTVVDGSSTFGFASDSRTTTTSTWAIAFAANRYLEFDLNDPLQDGLGITAASFTLRFAGTTAGSTACYYFEVRRVSTGAVLATHGSGASPVACVTGTTPTTSTTPIPSLDTSALANDLRIRVFGRDSGGAGIILDRAVVSGNTAYAAFTLYPVLFVDAADTTPLEIPWDLSGP
jgi:hypothetical protein